VQSPWHAQLRGSLGRYGGARAALFGISGVVAGIGYEWGLLLGAATLLWFMLQAVAALAQALLIEKESPS